MLLILGNSQVMRVACRVMRGLRSGFGARMRVLMLATTMRVGSLSANLGRHMSSNLSS